MGITGLLPVLKSITRNISLKELSGLRVAVDGYVWLHKGVYGCSKEIVQNIPTDKYVKYCMDNIKVLMEHGITPVIVFDGANLPMKQLEEEERRESREKYKAQAVEYTKQGKFNEANECYKKVVDITPAIAYRFIRELKIHGIEFIVAPYEADAQLAYLSQIGFVDAIISEDSDLLPYGASRVIYKFDKKSGTGQEILISDLRNNKELDFRSFNKDNFRHMCILSGCDYLKNIAGVGVKKAHQFVSRFKCPSRIIQAMRQVHKVPHNYENDFKRADLTFLHQWVWDPVQKKIVPLNHFEQDVNLDDFSHLGLKIDDKVGQLIAEGIINPTTKQPYECLPLDSQKPVTFMQKKPLTLTNTTQTKIIKPLKEVEYSTERKKTPLFLNKSTPPLQNTIDNQITVTSKYFNNKTLPLVPKTTPKPQILSPPTPPSNDNATNINAPSAPPFKKPRSFITRTDKKSLSYQHDSQMNSTQKLETIKNLNARFDCEMRELEYIDSNSTSPIEIREYHLKQQQCSGRVQFNMSTKSVSPPQYNLIQLSDEENIRELDEENDYDNDNDNDNGNDNGNPKLNFNQPQTECQSIASQDPINDNKVTGNDNINVNVYEDNKENGDENGTNKSGHGGNNETIPDLNITYKERTPPNSPKGDIGSFSSPSIYDPVSLTHTLITSPSLETPTSTTRTARPRFTSLTPLDFPNTTVLSPSLFDEKQFLSGMKSTPSKLPLPPSITIAPPSPSITILPFSFT
uniref:Exonuclease 1 n=1 Tax=Arcella intermedia TaxID=1963864 RepID=A0A6B2KYP5_9EUKA